jgi:hypothetical protein
MSQPTQRIQIMDDELQARFHDAVKDLEKDMPDPRLVDTAFLAKKVAVFYLSLQDSGIEYEESMHLTMDFMYGAMRDDIERNEP